MSDGMDCDCGAYGECECGCGADWTDQRVYDLQYEVKYLRKTLNDLLNDCINFDTGTLTPLYMENASRVLKEVNIVEKESEVEQLRKDLAQCQLTLNFANVKYNK